MKKILFSIAVSFISCNFCFAAALKSDTNNILEQELNGLIQEAQIRQAQHPVFDPQYKIIPNILKEKLLTELKSYYTFPEQHKNFEHKISEKILTRRIKKAQKAIARQKQHTGNINIKRTKLKKSIVNALNIEFLYSNLAKYYPEVETISEADKKGYTLKQLQFNDRHVGTFKVTAFIPKGEGTKIPAAVFFHGHGQSIEECLKTGFIEKALSKNIAVFIPQFKAMELTQEEFVISKKLLLHGFSLMGIRVYEASLLLKHITSLEFIDAERIAFIAHSGGSVIASLLAVLEDNIKAKVIDARTDFLSITDLYGIHCETVPALAPFRRMIIDENSRYTPTLVTEYGAYASEQGLLFLEQHLTRQ